MIQFKFKVVGGSQTVKIDESTIVAVGCPFCHEDSSLCSHCESDNGTCPAGRLKVGERAFVQREDVHNWMEYRWNDGNDGYFYLMVETIA